MFIITCKNGVYVMVLKLEIGDVFAWQDYSLLGLIIQLITQSKVNHVSMYIGNGKIIESDIGGVRIITVEQHFKRPCWYKVWLLKLTDIDRQVVLNHGRKFNNTLNQYNGTSYGWDAVFTAFCDMIMPFVNWQVTKNVDCSDLIATIYKNCGLPIEKVTSDYSPKEILELKFYESKTDISKTYKQLGT